MRRLPGIPDDGERESAEVHAIGSVDGEYSLHADGERLHGLGRERGAGVHERVHDIGVERAGEHAADGEYGDTGECGGECAGDEHGGGDVQRGGESADGECLHAGGGGERSHRGGRMR